MPSVTPQIVVIAAVAENGVIGANNALPWRIPEDLKRFKQLTMGHPIVMGRKTWESLGRPLPGRHNIVITRNPAYLAEGATVVASLDAALEVAEREGQEAVYVIGGGEIYSQALPRAARLELTEVKANVVGDAFFPEIDWSVWLEQSREKHRNQDGLAFDFAGYSRLPA